MLYPDFFELVACKEGKRHLMQSSRRSKTIVPGNHHSPFRGQGLEFDSVREYVLGDDIRNIDWRVTARTGVPQVKLFQEERKRTRLIAVDMNETMRFGTKNTFKSIQAARVAAFLGTQGLAAHDSISACLYGDVQGGIQYFAPTKTRKTFCTLLKTLSLPPSVRHLVTTAQALQHISKAAHTGSLVFLISDFMDIDASFLKEASLSRLNIKCDLVFIAINDSADSVIAPIGTLKFSTNAKKIDVNTDDIQGRESYARLFKESRERLYETTKKFKIPLIELTTESDIRKDLFLGLKSIARRKR